MRAGADERPPRIVGEHFDAEEVRVDLKTNSNQIRHILNRSSPSTRSGINLVLKASFLVRFDLFEIHARRQPFFVPTSSPIRSRRGVTKPGTMTTSA